MIHVQVLPEVKVIYPKYYKHWLYNLATTFDCSCWTLFSHKNVCLEQKNCIFLLSCFITFIGNTIIYRTQLLLLLFYSWKYVKKHTSIKETWAKFSVQTWRPSWSKNSKRTRFTGLYITWMYNFAWGQLFFGKCHPNPNFSLDWSSIEPHWLDCKWQDRPWWWRLRVSKGTIYIKGSLNWHFFTKAEDCKFAEGPHCNKEHNTKTLGKIDIKIFYSISWQFFSLLSSVRQISPMV